MNRISSRILDIKKDGFPSGPFLLGNTCVSNFYYIGVQLLYRLVWSRILNFFMFMFMFPACSTMGSQIMFQLSIAALFEEQFVTWFQAMIITIVPPVGPPVPVVVGRALKVLGMEYNGVAMTAYR